MKLNLVRVAFMRSGSPNLPSWVDLRFDIEVPDDAGVAGEMSVSIDMAREEFERSTINDLAKLGEAQIRERTKL